ncbi:MAG: adenylyltransferase/cytidyltransferase family protein [Candidatus Woesearchaeota archaeon]|jgi:rfaE bifunctional protein nucleotidyltransferase chain/domain|nr:adenylyltransferase/cytidyltransferase family protein [Candidatus Woesearchaeota archaeon]MDP7622720.1 adenylyltransferase/cytidyltransferase family protein [Candidatus Woesearchaeota archaeon]HJN57061.1 adenylyltransferase/cytidyltransferase family protein [Candidatus Woesearchaeota archaeon]|tara:strand:+ start:307 stop:795 length:489 start_codon:yes stop_codon:yes gene_type:complete
MSQQKIKTINELKDISEKLRNQNKKVITTNGVFDILHIGHIRYLKEAKKLGDVLIVGINSDFSVKNIKEPQRPLNNQDDRAEAIASLEVVNFVVIFNEPNPIYLLGVIKPSIHVKGRDYNLSEIVEKDTVESNNGKVVLIPEVKGYSTTNFIKKILDIYKNQ